MDYVGGTCQCNETSISGHREKCSRAIRGHEYSRLHIVWHIYQAIYRHKKRFHADELRLRNCKRFSVVIRQEAAIEYIEIYFLAIDLSSSAIQYLCNIYRTVYLIFMISPCLDVHEII